VTGNLKSRPAKEVSMEHGTKNTLQGQRVWINPFGFSIKVAERELAKPAPPRRKKRSVENKKEKIKTTLLKG